MGSGWCGYSYEKCADRNVPSILITTVAWWYAAISGLLIPLVIASIAFRACLDIIKEHYILKKLEEDLNDDDNDEPPKPGQERGSE